MAELSPNAALTRRLERQLAEAGLQVTVEPSDGGLILSDQLSAMSYQRSAISDQSTATLTADS